MDKHLNTEHEYNPSNHSGSDVAHVHTDGIKKTLSYSGTLKTCKIVKQRDRLSSRSQYFLRVYEEPERAHCVAKTVRSPTRL
jgi:hypothetical protein